MSIPRRRKLWLAVLPLAITVVALIALAAASMYVLSGDGRRDAEIARETTPGSSRRGEIRAQRMEYIPAGDQLNISQASSGQGGT